MERDGVSGEIYSDILSQIRMMFWPWYKFLEKWCEGFVCLEICYYCVCTLIKFYVYYFWFLIFDVHYHIL